MENPEVEKIVSELLRLARQTPLPKEKQDRAKELMKMLREKGFTNKEISRVSQKGGGGWSEATVKLYTRGSVVRDPSQKEKALALLVELLNRNLTLGDVENDLSIRKSIEEKGLTFDEFLTYKSEFDALKFPLKEANLILEAAKQYGGHERVFEAIKEYGSLEGIRKEIRERQSEMSQLEKSNQDLREAKSKLEGEKRKIEDRLALYHKIEGLGFDYDSLAELMKATEKYNAQEILQAVNTYLGIKDLQREKTDLESKFKKAQADHAHLQQVILLCDALLYKYGFSISAVESLRSITEKYGGSTEVLKAIGKYGELKELEDDIKDATSRKSRLESEREELDKQIEGKRATANELDASIKKSLGLLSTATSESLRNLEKETAGTLKNLAATIKNMSASFEDAVGSLKGASGKLLEEYTAVIDSSMEKLLKAGEAYGRIEARKKEEENLSALLNLMEKPETALTMPIETVMYLALRFVNALLIYLEANQDNIPRQYKYMTSQVKTLSEELTRRVRENLT